MSVEGFVTRHAYKARRNSEDFLPEGWLGINGGMAKERLAARTGDAQDEAGSQKRSAGPRGFGDSAGKLKRWLNLQRRTVPDGGEGKFEMPPTL